MKCFGLSGTTQFGLIVIIGGVLALVVEVTPVFAPDRRAMGRLKVDRFPVPQSSSSPENLYRARIEFDSKLVGILPGMRGSATFPAADAAGQ